VLEQNAGTGGGRAQVRVKNTSSSVAFQIRLRLADKKDRDVVPVFWQDNYFSLLPGEERIVTVNYETAELHGARPHIQVSGFNVAPGEVPIQSGAVVH
jgi:exo-1,4-beta-D-glucosaminidase